MESTRNRPTVHDIAREAGVSLATVDRVLNARSGVRAATIAKVQAAIQRLGYVRDRHAANLARQRQYRFAFVLPEGPNHFTDTLKQTLKDAYASQIADRTSLKVVSVPTHDPHLTVRSLQSLDASRLDGVAVMAPETPQLRDAVDRLKDAGLSVVALASDLPSSRRDYFIGIDNIAAGRTAGLLMGRFLGGAGDVLVVTNSLRSRDSLERRLGFDQVMYEQFPNARVLPTIESYDDAARIDEILARVLTRSAEIAGLYSMGLGNRAILHAMRKTGARRKLTVIAHELTPLTREALLRDEAAAVISQNLGHLIRSALRVLRSLCDGVPIFDAQERMRIEIVLKENLPEQPL